MHAIPAAPPLAEVNHRRVRAWAEAAAAGLARRSEGLRLVRHVERILADEARTARPTVTARERIEQRLALANERAAGTHWKRRDGGRRAKQAIHVDVDLAAWRRAKARTATKGMTIGHYVGTLVRSAAAQELPATDTFASTSRLFVRVDVDMATWGTFKARGVTAARGVGMAVEAGSMELARGC